MKVGSIFSGAGLGDLGLTWAGFEHEFFCELDPFARSVLALRWPGVKVYEDVTELNGYELPQVDILIGGFPCQPFSSAAHGANIQSKDRKHELVRLAKEIKPRIVIGENVNRKPVDSVASGLRELGYGTEVFHLSSSQFGADHKRGRWWVVAHADMHRKLCSTVYAEASMLQKLRKSVRGGEDYARAIRVSDGCPDRMDRLKCLGNGQDPFATYAIARSITN